jgi:hypothetical protein
MLKRIVFFLLYKFQSNIRSLPINHVQQNRITDKHDDQHVKEKHVVM